MLLQCTIENVHQCYRSKELPLIQRLPQGPALGGTHITCDSWPLTSSIRAALLFSSSFLVPLQMDFPQQGFQSSKYTETTSHCFVASLTRQAEKAMASHSSTLAWKIPWMEEPGGLPSLGSLRVGHD